MPQITLDLREFIDILLGPTLGPHYVDAKVAEKLLVVDPEESLIHVEFPSEVNGNIKPEVWMINDWNTEYSNYVKRKALSNLERIVHLCMADLTSRVAKSIFKETGVDMEKCNEIARRVCLKRHKAQLVALTGTHIIEFYNNLIKADEELRLYKVAQGII